MSVACKRMRLLFLVVIIGVITHKSIGSSPMVVITDPTKAVPAELCALTIVHAGEVDAVVHRLGLGPNALLPTGYFSVDRDLPATGRDGGTVLLR